MTNEQLKEFVDVALQHKGQFGATIVMDTKPRFTKKEIAEIGGEVRKVSQINNVALGWSYERVVKARGGVDFVAEKPSGMHPIIDDLLYEADKDASRHYLRFYASKANKIEVEYFVDDTPATEEQITIIETIIKTKARPPQKQLDAGVEKLVYPRSVLAENIVKIKGWGYES